MTARSGSSTQARADKALDAHGIRLMDALTRINRSLRRHATTTLTLGNLSALGSIVEAGRIRPGDLAVREGIAPATLSRIIANLEQYGYVARHTDPDDGRSFFLTATDKGAGELTELRRSRSAVLLGQLQDLDETDQAVLFDALPVLEILAARAQMLAEE